MKKAILWGTLVLFIGYLFIFWLFTYSPMGGPANDSGTPLLIKGVSLMVFVLVVFIILFRKYLRANPEASIWELVVIAGIAGLFSDVFFQVIRQFTFTDLTPTEHLRYMAKDTLIMTVIAVVFGFLVAFQLKTKKGWWILVFLVILLFLFNLFGSFNS